MIRTCELWELNSEAKRELCGTVSWDGRTLEVSPAPGSRLIPDSIFSACGELDGKALHAADNPELWFENLPRIFHGSYLWAEAPDPDVTKLAPAVSAQATLPTKVTLGESAVRERQIDFILQEEFSVRQEFLQDFLAASCVSIPSPELPKGELTVIDVRASVRDRNTDASSGETDVLVLYRTEDDDSEQLPRAILIEDKIDAAFQIDQAKRYLLRGEFGLGQLWSSFLTCLVAPESYIKEGHGFQISISLEKLTGLLAVDSPPRHKFRQALINSAIQIEKQRGLKQEDIAVTEFRLRYYESFNDFRRAVQSDNEAEKLEGVEAQLPRRAWWGDTWFRFHGPALDHGVYIEHKAQAGAVDLTFQHTDRAVLAGRVGSIEHGMSIVKIGKRSASIRLKVPVIASCIDFPVHRQFVQDAFVAVRRLTAFYRALPK